MAGAITLPRHLSPFKVHIPSFQPVQLTISLYGGDKDTSSLKLEADSGLWTSKSMTIMFSIPSLPGQTPTALLRQLLIKLLCRHDQLVVFSLSHHSHRESNTMPHRSDAQRQSNTLTQAGLGREHTSRPCTYTKAPYSPQPRTPGPPWQQQHSSPPSAADAPPTNPWSVSLRTLRPTIPAWNSAPAPAST